MENENENENSTNLEKNDENKNQENKNENTNTVESEEKEDTKDNYSNNQSVFNSSDLNSNTFENEEKSKKIQDNSNSNNSNTNDEEEASSSGSYFDVLKAKISGLYNFYITMPLFTIIISLIYTSFYLIRLFSSAIADFFSNIPNKVLGSFHIWTIFSGTIVPSGFINLLVTLITWTYFAKSLENSLSTIRFMINFTIDSLILSSFYFIIHFLLSFYGNWRMNGLLGVAITQSTLLCLANPNVPMSLVVYEIDAKYFPAILSLVMLVLHFGKAMDILFGLIYAFLFFYLLRIQISDEITAKFEEIFSFLSRFSSFVSISDTSKPQSGFSVNEERAKKPESSNHFNKIVDSSINKNEISIEKLDKSSDRGNKISSLAQVNYINLEDDKVA